VEGKAYLISELQTLARSRSAEKMTKATRLRVNGWTRPMVPREISRAYLLVSELCWRLHCQSTNHPKLLNFQKAFCSMKLMHLRIYR
jgi:hypothetical protein